MKYGESKEDYLERILMLKKSGEKNVRQVDIARDLEFSKASVSVAMKNLSDLGLIEIENDGSIEFTEEGLYRAEKVYERHMELTRFLVSIGVSKDIAEKDACHIEHVISEETFEKIKDLSKNL